MTDKEDKTRKAIVYAKQKINQLTSERAVARDDTAALLFALVVLALFPLLGPS